MTRAFDSLRSIFIWMTALPVFIVCSAVIVMTTLLYRGPVLERMIKGTCRLVLALSRVQIRVRGAENAVPGRAYILMMNHVNFLDAFVLYAAFPGFARGVEEESHFNWPVYGLLIRRIGLIPISRKNTARARDSLTRAAALIGRMPGYSFAVLPEGTRTRDGRLGPFKRGGFHLALESGLPILPVIQIGAGRINRKGSKLIRPGRIEVWIEPAVSAAGYTAETIPALVERTRAVFLKRLGESSPPFRPDSPRPEGGPRS